MGLIRENKICDIHSHIVYGIDDGSIDLKMSIDMLRDAYKQGIKSVICTSHSGSNIEKYYKNLNMLKDKLKKKNIDINLYPGCEIYCCYDNIENIITQLDNKRIPSINNTKYVLIEFEPDILLSEIIYCCKEIIQHNYIPIIAHIERYQNLFILNYGIDILKNMECIFQVNIYSLQDERDTKIKENARYLLNKKYITFVGSDSHSMYHRPYMITNGIEYIYEKCTDVYADDILYKNAQFLLNIK